VILQGRRGLGCSGWWCVVEVAATLGLPLPARPVEGAADTMPAATSDPHTGGRKHTPALPLLCNALLRKAR
jgi:hypothetical protein